MWGCFEVGPRRVGAPKGHQNFALLQTNTSKRPALQHHQNSTRRPPTEERKKRAIFWAVRRRERSGGRENLEDTTHSTHTAHTQHTHNTQHTHTSLHTTTPMLFFPEFCLLFHHACFFSCLSFFIFHKCMFCLSRLCFFCTVAFFCSASGFFPEFVVNGGVS